MINNQRIEAYSITNDNEKIVYISNQKSTYGPYANCKECIIMTDLELNYIKSLDINYNPYGICYSNEILCVADSNNRKIHKYTSQLQYLETLQLDFPPLFIKILDNTICVNCAFGSGLYFYNLETFQKKIKHHHGYCRQISLGSLFYEFGMDSNKLYCYNNEGNLLRQYDLKLNADYFQCTIDGCTIFYNNFFIISSFGKRRLLKFIINE